MTPAAFCRDQLQHLSATQENPVVQRAYRDILTRCSHEDTMTEEVFLTLVNDLASCAPQIPMRLACIQILDTWSAMKASKHTTL